MDASRSKVCCFSLRSIFASKPANQRRPQHASAPHSGHVPEQQSTLWLSFRALSTGTMRLSDFVSALGPHDCRRRCNGPGSETISWGSCMDVECSGTWTPHQMYSPLECRVLKRYICGRLDLCNRSINTHISSTQSLLTLTLPNNPSTTTQHKYNGCYRANMELGGQGCRCHWLRYAMLPT
jgi:hypothetical protein